MADPALGQKQICPNCQSKFYDLAKRPAHCPKCEFEFDPEEALKSRRARPRAAVRDFEEAEPEAKPVRDEDTEAFEEEAETTPEIDQAADEPDANSSDDDDAEDGAATTTKSDDDLGVDFDEEADSNDEDSDDDDVPFLEDEDSDDNDDIAVPGSDEEER